MTALLPPAKIEGIDKLPDLTPKQRIFLKEYFRTGNGTQSAMKAYDTTEEYVAASIASQNLRKLKVTIRDFMESKGIGLTHLVSILAGAMQADKWNDFTGEREADHPVRLKAMEICAKWLGVESQNDTPDNLKKRIVAEEFFES